MDTSTTSNMGPGDTGTGGGPTHDGPYTSGGPGPQRPPTFSTGGIHRSRDQRVIAGVCGGLARRLNVDPALLRVLVVVLAIFGGVGIVAYAVAWLVLPEEPAKPSVFERAFGSQENRSDNRPVLLAVGLLAAIGLFVLGGISIGSHAGIIALAVVVVIVALVMRGGSDGGGDTGTPPSYSPAASQGTGYAASTMPLDPAARPAAPVGPWSTPPGTPYPGADEPTISHATAAVGAPAPVATDETAASWIPPSDDPYAAAYPPAYATPPARPRRPRSYLGIVTVSTIILALGVLGTIDAAGAAVSPVAYPFTALVITGLALLASTMYGRSRGLIALGILIGMVFLPMAAIDSVTDGRWVNWQSGTGVQEKPTQISDIQPTYEADTGQLVLDLREIDFTSRTVTTTLNVGAGEVKVLVPPDVDVDVTGTVGLGTIDFFDQWHAGADLSATETDLGADGTGSGRIELDVHVDLGVVEVTREAA